MKSTIRLLTTVSLLAASFTGFAAAQDKTEIEVFHAWAGHQRFHKPIAKAFMKL